MFEVIRLSRVLLLPLTVLITTSIHAQSANLVLEDTTITTVSIFTATNSIAAGPNFSITASGDATFETGGFVYLRPVTAIIRGGKLQVILDSTIVAINRETFTIPAKFTLKQNYPNPFNPTTTIEFALAKPAWVTLKIYNILGQEVAELVSENLSAGNYKYNWDATGLASGVYYYRIETEGFVQTKKMLLIR